MKKTLLFLTIILALALFSACGGSVDTTSDASQKDTTAPETTKEVEMGLTSPEGIKLLRQEIWNDYVESLPASRKTELVKNGISYITVGAQKMKVETKVIGNAPEGGYPIFIVLHGGGSDPTGEMNESQWRGMAARYARKAGIYVSCRAIEDTWNCHSVDNAYKFYDRIIENACIYMNGNPNMAYIVGYSAGGDGVYQIAPRMADRFASATMTAGHPNGVSGVNLYNLPFYLQVGELDTAYSRNTETVKYGMMLDGLKERFGGGYANWVFVHVGKEHGVVGDNATAKQNVVDDTEAWLKSGGRSGVGGSVSETTHAAFLMTEHIRNPLPERVIWDLSCRTPRARSVLSFYWVSAPATTTDGILDISYDKATNTVKVNSCSVKKGKITVYLSEDMLDLFSEVTFDFNGKVMKFAPTLSEETIRKTTKERGDVNYQFVSSFTFDTEGNVTSK